MAEPQGMLAARTYLWLLLAVSFVSGILLGIEFSPRTEKLIDVFFLVATSSLVFLWYCADSHSRGYRRSILSNMGVVFLAILALPYYFFRSRGLRGGFLALGKSVLFLTLIWALVICGWLGSMYVVGA
jgi:hypothetical protein